VVRRGSRVAWYSSTDRLVVLEGVHLGEIVVVDDLGETRHEGVRVVAGLHVLRRQVHRLLDLRHRPHHAEVGDLDQSVGGWL
jgi:hypothetical protein